MLKLVSYVIAFVSLAGIELLFWPVSWKLAVWLRSARNIAPYISGTLDFLKIFVAIALSVWVIRAIGYQPTWLMYIIPGIAMYMNDTKRLHLAKRGISNVRRMFHQSGEPDSYEQSTDIFMERAHLTGDFLGWIFGVSFFLRSAEFL